MTKEQEIKLSTYKGKRIGEMTREELEIAIYEIAKMYSETLDRHINELNELG